MYIPEVVKRVASESKIAGGLDCWLSRAEQEKRAASAIPGAKLLSSHYHRAVLAVADEHTLKRTRTERRGRRSRARG